MEVRIVPAEGSLQDVVQLGEVEVHRQQQAAPDRWVDLSDRDSGLDDEVAAADHIGIMAGITTRGNGPPSAVPPAPKPRRDETLIKALVRAHRWRRRIESGQAKSITNLAA
jgi:hypothetical protein